MNNETGNAQITDLGRYAWDYFHYHAGQRLTTFNFYIIICSLVITGYITAIKDAKTVPFGIVVGLLLPLVSFVFWQLDRRNKEMIKNAEEALKSIEKNTIIPNAAEDPPVQHIFRYEEVKTASARRNSSCWPWAWRLSYSKCFNAVFATLATIGLAGAIYVAALTWSKSTAQPPRPTDRVLPAASRPSIPSG